MIGLYHNLPLRVKKALFLHCFNFEKYSEAPFHIIVLKNISPGPIFVSWFNVFNSTLRAISDVAKDH